jgi:hypothetical protein
MRALPTRIRLESGSDNLQSRTIFWLLLFLSLNIADSILTNKAHAMLELAGLEGKMAEANLILRPLAGSWLLLLKGAFALIIILAFNKLTGMPVRKVIQLACLALGIICIWNARSIGMI